MIHIDDGEKEYRVVKLYSVIALGLSFYALISELLKL